MDIETLGICLKKCREISETEVRSQVAQSVTSWLGEHVDPDTGYVIDDTLSIQGAAADAKATGDAVGDLKSVINQEMELGALASGNDSASTSAVRCKGYVYAPTGTRIRASKYNNTNFNVTVCQYDANKNFLTGQNLTISGGGTSSAVTGSSTRYVRYFFWAVPGLVASVTDEDLEAFALLVSVTLPKGVSENRIDIDALKSKVATNETDIDTLESVTTENYATLINALSVVSDLNDVNTNVAYRLNYALNATSIPAHSPYGNSWKSERIVYFLSIVKTEGSHTAGDMQLFFGSDGVYERDYAASWKDWYLISNKNFDSGQTFIVDASGGGDYTSLCEAIVTALLTEGTTVYVKQGTYDAISEMKALYGNDYFDNFTSAGENLIYLQNDIKIICEPGTIMTCNYTGDNAYVKSYFAPINFRRGKATIENLEINASNVRYCIHDDQWDSTTPYTHILKNCHLIIDNSNNEEWERRLAYGGGLGVHGYVEFDDCYFKSVGLDGSAYSGYGACGFHNSPSADARNRVVLNNCYFADNSTFRFTYYGQATVKSKAFVSGCSLGREMELTNEDAVLSPNVNVEIIDCNNVIRT